MKLSHIVHALVPNEGSDLITAQPMTFESMRRSKRKFDQIFKDPTHNLELLCTVFPGNIGARIPKGFTKAKNLDRNLSDELNDSRKLPFISDIFDRCYDSGADYLIYTNVDIAVTEDFYYKAKSYIDLGHDAIIVNRTTMPSYSNQSLDWFLNNIETGTQHPGYDCFIISKDLYKKMNLGKIVIGVNWIGETLLQNIFFYSKNPILLQRPYMTFHMGDDRTWITPKHTKEREWNQLQAQSIISKFNNNAK